MIELILPGMVQRNKGIIVNFASGTGWRPLPYMCTYPASKAAISFFSSSLCDEFRHTNIHIQCLIPLLVATKIACYEKDDERSFLILSPEDYARQAVRLIGNWDVATGCWLHDMQIAACALVSFWLFKLFFVPFGLLKIHRNRLNAYAMRKGKCE